eukprot:2561411-Pyramimonas_sp.AAC.2
MALDRMAVVMLAPASSRLPPPTSRLPPPPSRLPPPPSTAAPPLMLTPLGRARRSRGPRWKGGMKEEEEEDDDKESEEREDARGRERVKRTRRRATTMRRLRKVKEEEENEREGGALGIRDPASPDKTALRAGATKAPEGARGVFSSAATLYKATAKRRRASLSCAR